MAKQALMFQNVTAKPTEVQQTGGNSAPGFPASNMQDWRGGSAHRWIANDTTTLQHVFEFSMQAPVTEIPDFVVIGGHNLGSQSFAVTIDAGDAIAYAPWHQDKVIDNDFPVQFRNVPAPTGLQTERIRLTIAASQEPSILPQIGIFTVGRAMELLACGVMGDLDAYGLEAVTTPNYNAYGSLLGMNVEYYQKSFTLSYGSGSDPGFPVEGGLRNPPAGELGYERDFWPHAVLEAQPFWYSWNWEEDPRVWLCRIAGGVGEPFVGSTKRRGIQATFEARQEVG